MKKKIISLIVVVVVIIFAVWVLQNKSTGSKEVIKIGVVAPVTGPSAAFGATLVKGVEMAAEDMSKVDTKNIYQVVVEDDGGSPAKSATAASKLINIDKVRAIISTTGGTGNAVKSIAEKNNVIHVSNSKDPSIGNVPYNYTNLMLPQEDAETWVAEALKRGNKTVAVLSQVHPGAAALIAALLPEAKKQGLEVVFEETFAGDNRDFKTIVLKAKQSKADIYMVEAYPPSLDIVTKELKDVGITNISTMGIFSSSANPNLYNGFWYTDCTLTDIDFRDRFVRTYPELTFTVITVPYGYDIFNMLVQSFEKGGDANENMKAITEYDGKAGKTTKVAGGQNFHTGASIWTMVNGVPEMVK
jgi:branched-chain amino acid transport system substrate-binding protein